MCDTATLFYVIERIGKMLFPIGFTSIDAEKINGAGEIALDESVTDLDRHAVRVSMRAHAPKKRIAGKSVHIEVAGSRTEKPGLLDQCRSRTIELALRIAEGKHLLAENALKPLLSPNDLIQGARVRHGVE